MSRSIPPWVAETLFPALRHFSGPDHICAALLGSGLSFQLETLKISNDITTYAALEKVADAVTELPKLRELEYPNSGAYMLGRRAGKTIYPSALRTIISAAPRLQKLGIFHYGYRRLTVSISNLNK